MAFAYFFIGLAAGLAAYYYVQRRQRRAQRRIPPQWPLKARPLLNSTEHAIWVWLERLFADQKLFVKLPVTRFTAPDQPTQAAHWYKLLNGVYCTFTVCRADGRVVGCVDVHNPVMLSLANQSLKHSLLSQCGIRYWVVDPANLPHATQLRGAFLGEEAMHINTHDKLDHRLRDTADSLHAAVTRQRVAHRERVLVTDIDPTALSGQGPATQLQESRIPSGWEQNSFVTPLDSRMADLN
jgi:hypothetical protein